MSTSNKYIITKLVPRDVLDSLHAQVRELNSRQAIQAPRNVNDLLRYRAEHDALAGQDLSTDEKLAELQNLAARLVAATLEHQTDSQTAPPSTTTPPAQSASQTAPPSTASAPAQSASQTAPPSTTTPPAPPEQPRVPPLRIQRYPILPDVGSSGSSGTDRGPETGFLKCSFEAPLQKVSFRE